MLPPGLAANASAVLVLTLGARMPGLRGGDFEDAYGDRPPGLISGGLPILKAPAGDLGALRARALDAGVEVRLSALRAADHRLRGVPRAQTPTAELEYLGLLFRGSRCAANRLTGSLPLLR